jgi:hypothetical protein
LDQAGQPTPLPPHVLLLSRAGTATGEKRRHYALVCRSAEPLQIRARGELHLGQFRNLGSHAERVGSSQVTSVLEHHGEDVGGLSYTVDMVANLVSPYYVRLAGPLLLDTAGREAVRRASSKEKSSVAWRRFVEQIRAAGQPISRTGQEAPDLFGGTAT